MAILYFVFCSCPCDNYMGILLHSLYAMYLQIYFYKMPIQFLWRFLFLRDERHNTNSIHRANNIFNICKYFFIISQV